jgi:hypothetical protein
VIVERLTGQLRVALSPAAAFRLFTPLGERDWAPGWAPRFPVPAIDDREPGTVFETQAHDRLATWVVVERTSGRSITYARVVPHQDAGIVTVTLDGAGGESTVTVTYALTALSEAGTAHLRAFARGYPAYLASWQDAIDASLLDVKH